MIYLLPILKHLEEQKEIYHLLKKDNENLKKIHNLQKKNKRLTTKVKTLEDLMSILEKKNLISENASTLLQVNYINYLYLIY